MPTVATIRGYRVVIHTNDHPPANVHVIGPDCEAEFILHCPHGPVELRENYRCSPVQLRRIRYELNRHLTRLCTAWENIHGPI
jgi:hypothetical protein